MMNLDDHHRMWEDSHLHHNTEKTIEKAFFSPAGIRKTGKCPDAVMQGNPKKSCRFSKSDVFPKTAGV